MCFLSYARCPCLRRVFLSGFRAPAPGCLGECVRWRVGALVQKRSRTTIERLCRLPEGQKSHILLTALHAADMGTIDAHSLRDRLLAEICSQSKTAKIPAKYLANVHPQDGCAPQGNRVKEQMPNSIRRGIRRLVILDSHNANLARRYHHEEA